jgi:phosphoglucosamine mutase
MGKLFGTDGVRGIANTELKPEFAFDLGRAATVLFGKEHEKPVFVIGRDTRVSGQMLEAALAAGICSAGGQAILLGQIPTPAVAYLTRKLAAQAGVVISASHNPYPDNGIKFFAGTGYKLPDAVEEQLEDLVLRQMDTLPRPTGAQVGTISTAMI